MSYLIPNLDHHGPTGPTASAFARAKSADYPPSTYVHTVRHPRDGFIAVPAHAHAYAQAQAQTQAHAQSTGRYDARLARDASEHGSPPARTAHGQTLLSPNYARPLYPSRQSQSHSNTPLKLLWDKDDTLYDVRKRSRIERQVIQQWTRDVRAQAPKSPGYGSTGALLWNSSAPAGVRRTPKGRRSAQVSRVERNKVPVSTTLTCGPEFGAVFGGASGGAGKLFHDVNVSATNAATGQGQGQGTDNICTDEYLDPSYGLPTTHGLSETALHVQNAYHEFLERQKRTAEWTSPSSTSVAAATSSRTSTGAHTFLAVPPPPPPPFAARKTHARQRSNARNEASAVATALKSQEGRNRRRSGDRGQASSSKNRRPRFDVPHDEGADTPGTTYAKTPRRARVNAGALQQKKASDTPIALPRRDSRMSITDDTVDPADAVDAIDTSFVVWTPAKSRAATAQKGAQGSEQGMPSLSTNADADAAVDVDPTPKQAGRRVLGALPTHGNTEARPQPRRNAAGLADMMGLPAKQKSDVTLPSEGSPESDSDYGSGSNARSGPPTPGIDEECAPSASEGAIDAAKPSKAGAPSSHLDFTAAVQEGNEGWWNSRWYRAGRSQAPTPPSPLGECPFDVVPVDGGEAEHSHSHSEVRPSAPAPAPAPDADAASLSDSLSSVVALCEADVPKPENMTYQEFWAGIEHLMHDHDGGDSARRYTAAASPSRAKKAKPEMVVVPVGEEHAEGHLSMIGSPLADAGCVQPRPLPVPPVPVPGVSKSEQEHTPQDHEQLRLRPVDSSSFSETRNLSPLELDADAHERAAARVDTKRESIPLPERAHSPYYPTRIVSAREADAETATQTETEGEEIFSGLGLNFQGLRQVASDASWLTRPREGSVGPRGEGRSPVVPTLHPMSSDVSMRTASTLPFAVPVLEGAARAQAEEQGQDLASWPWAGDAQAQAQAFAPFAEALVSNGGEAATYDLSALGGDGDAGWHWRWQGEGEDPLGSVAATGIPAADTNATLCALAAAAAAAPPPSLAQGLDLLAQGVPTPAEAGHEPSEWDDVVMGSASASASASASGRASVCSAAAPLALPHGQGATETQGETHAEADAPAEAPAPAPAPTPAPAPSMHRSSSGDTTARRRSRTQSWAAALGQAQGEGQVDGEGEGDVGSVSMGMPLPMPMAGDNDNFTRRPQHQRDYRARRQREVDLELDLDFDFDVELDVGSVQRAQQSTAYAQGQAHAQRWRVFSQVRSGAGSGAGTGRRAVLVAAAARGAEQHEVLSLSLPFEAEAGAEAYGDGEVVGRAQGGGGERSQQGQGHGQAQGQHRPSLSITTRLRMLLE